MGSKRAMATATRSPSPVASPILGHPHPGGPERPGTVQLSLTVSPKFVGLLRDLGDRLGGDPPGMVLLKGIALLKAAMDARDQGKAIGAAASAEVLDTEFLGF